MNQSAYPDIPGFRVVAEIGRGASSRVFRAWQAGIEREVALKFVPCTSVVTAERLAREARIIGSVRHPGLVEVYATGVAPGGCWLAMQLLSAGTLQQRLDRGPMTWVELRRTLAPALDALALLHERGVVHRDIKPGNILLDAEGHAKLGDLGLARAAEDARLTVENGMLGTPLYMAPEQVRDPAHVGPQADVFATAVMVHALLNGRPAFEAGSIAAVVARVLTESLPPVAAAAQAPVGLDALLARATSKNPKLRPADGRAFLQALELVGMPDLRARRRKLAVIAGAVVSMTAWLWLARMQDSRAPGPSLVVPVVVPASRAASVEMPPPDAGLDGLLARWRHWNRSGASAGERDAAEQLRPRLERSAVEVLKGIRTRWATATRWDSPAGGALSIAALIETWPLWLQECAAVRAEIVAMRTQLIADLEAQQEALLKELCAEVVQIAAPDGEGVCSLDEFAAMVERRMAKNHGVGRLDGAHRARLRAAQQQHAEALLQGAETQLEGAFGAVALARAKGDFVQAAQCLANMTQRFVPGIATADGRIRAAMAALLEAEGTACKDLDAALTHLASLLLSRAEGALVLDACAAVATAGARVPGKPLDPGLTEKLLREQRMVQSAMSLQPQIQDLALARLGTLRGTQIVLRLCGEAPRGQRMLVTAADGVWEFERSEDAHRFRVLWDALDAATRLELAGLATDTAALGLLLLLRVQADDAAAVQELFAIAPEALERWIKLREQRVRDALTTEAERFAAAALERAALAMRNGDYDGALVHAAEVQAIRGRAGTRSTTAWPGLLKSARQIAEQSTPQRDRVRQWRAAGWAPVRDRDAGELRATPSAEDGALRLPEGTQLREGIHSIPAGHSFEIRLPDGVRALALRFTAAPAMLQGTWGTESFCVLGAITETGGARGEALHGLERDIRRTFNVSRAVVFKGPPSRWSDHWHAAVPFESGSAATEWRLERDAAGKSRLCHGTAVLEFASSPGQAILTLSCSQPLGLAGVRLSAPLILTR